jgi:hypothetical protein
MMPLLRALRAFLTPGFSMTTTLFSFVTGSLTFFSLRTITGSPRRTRRASIFAEVVDVRVRPSSTISWCAAGPDSLKQGQRRADAAVLDLEVVGRSA